MCIHTIPERKIERKHKHLLNTAHAFLFHAYLPVHFWGDCLLTATHLINRLPTVMLRGKSPYQLLFNKLHDRESLRVFGSLCYASTAPKFSDTFSP